MKDLGRGPSHLELGYVNCGEARGWREEIQELEVVESDDGDVRRHAQTHLIQSAAEPQRAEIVVTGDGGRPVLWLPVPEVLEPRLVPLLEAVSRRHDEVAREDEPGLAVGAPHSLEPFLAVE